MPLNEKLDSLKERIVRMSSFASAMIAHSVRGLADRDEAVLKEIIEVSEPRVNEMEVELDEFCTGLIALHEPKARDLRLILMALKMSNDMERIGDHAVNMAQSGLFLIARPPVKPLVDIPRLSEEATLMLGDSLDAFIREDPLLARAVLRRDDIVDQLRNKIFVDLMEFMTANPATVERSLHLIRITQNLERVADLSTNIAEDVVYFVEGKVVKHRHE